LVVSPSLSLSGGGVFEGGLREVERGGGRKGEREKGGEEEKRMGGKRREVGEKVTVLRKEGERIEVGVDTVINALFSKLHIAVSITLAAGAVLSAR